jgi:hypothetical protein
MLRKIYGTNFFHTNIKCQNGPVLPPAQVFYFNGQALTLFGIIFDTPLNDHQSLFRIDSVHQFPFRLLLLLLFFCWSN